MIRRIAALGRLGLSFLQSIGESGLFLLQILIGRPTFRKSFPLVIKQIYVVGVLSLPIIIVAALFIGLVLGLEGHIVLVKFGAEQAIGQLIALSLVRELGPVLGGLLFAGRACSALTAEIALMKATEQLASLEMMGIDPFRRIIAPRFWAGQIAMPVLMLIFNAVAIYGGYLIVVKWLYVDAGSFWSNMQLAVNFYDDILNGVIKSFVFGFIIVWIAVFQGYNAVPTAEGIAYATTRTVVYSSLAILSADFVLTAVMFGGL
jgi:phospholipid/cholesterol/gamma-HCH transport system permease protein